VTEETLQDIEDGKYRAGEVWNYETCPGFEGSTLTVLKVESSSRVGVIVHISVDGFRVASPHAPNGAYEKIGHMPFAEEAIERSVTNRAAVGTALPADNEGYEEWRRARGGVFTITVAEAVDLVLGVVPRG
jgi:hypothetical protein